MSRNEEFTVPEVAVERGDWESFVTSLERFMTLHQRTLQRVKELWVRNRALREELRSAMTLPTIKVREKVEAFEPYKESVSFQLCRFCGREIEKVARFCDSCGRLAGALRCECGRELTRDYRFCDACGRPANQR